MLDSISKFAAQDLSNLDDGKLTEYNDLFDFREDYSVNKLCLTKTNWPITPDVFNELFPFNIVFDSNLVVCGIGNVFNRLCSSLAHNNIADYFKLHTPPISFTYANITMHQNEVFHLKCRRNCTIEFKGEMIINSVSAQVVFNGSPIVDSLEFINKCNIFVSDLFYLMDCQEAIFLNMHLTTAKQVRKSLEAARHNLDISQRETKAEKKRALDLLHSILPSFAIEKYMRGEEFEPTKYDNATILFSDIKGFANICNFYEPLEAVKLLDYLFCEFDHLSEMYGVFKVCNTIIIIVIIITVIIFMCIIVGEL